MSQYELNALKETADDALQYALDGLDRLDAVEARLLRLETTLTQLLLGHPGGALTALELELAAYKPRPATTE